MISLKNIAFFAMLADLEALKFLEVGDAKPHKGPHRAHKGIKNLQYDSRFERRKCSRCNDAHKLRYQLCSVSVDDTAESARDSGCCENAR